MPGLRTIAVVYGQAELGLLRAMLADQGIMSGTVGRGHVAVAWSMALGLGGVHLMVREEDFEAASELLGALEPFRYQRGLLLPNRLADALLILLLFAMSFVPPPVRIPATFYFARRS